MHREMLLPNCGIVERAYENDLGRLTRLAGLQPLYQVAVEKHVSLR